MIAQFIEVSYIFEVDNKTLTHKFAINSNGDLVESPLKFSGVI